MLQVGIFVITLWHQLTNVSMFLLIVLFFNLLQYWFVFEIILWGTRNSLCRLSISNLFQYNKIKHNFITTQRSSKFVSCPKRLPYKSSWLRLCHHFAKKWKHWFVFSFWRVVSLISHKEIWCLALSSLFLLILLWICRFYRTTPALFFAMTFW